NLTPGKVDAGLRSVTVDSWEGEHRQFKVAAGPEPTARVRTYYYPHWKATANGQTLATRAADDGAILISLPPASADITLTFEEPARVRYAEVLSLLAWLAITAAVVSRFALSTQISHHLLVAANSR